MELSLFTFFTIANATTSFLEDNKIREGGFGPVYKGTKGAIRGAPLLQLEVSTCMFVRLFLHGDVGIVMFLDNSGVTTSHVAARKRVHRYDEGVAARHESCHVVIGTDVSTLLEGQPRVE
ncbi:hypothetical protein Tco_0948862, partial [Tanacetum coccineum]